MYGTIARLRVKPGMEASIQDEMRRVGARRIPGMVATYVYRMDRDPRESFLVVMFDSKEAYHANAQDPRQHEDYLRLLDSRRMRISMSGKGDCYDNAAMESFWATLKTELVNHEHYATHAQARASVCVSNSRNSSSNRWMSSSISWGSVAMIILGRGHPTSCVLRRSLADKFVQQHAGDHVQRLEDTFATMSAGRERRHLNLAVVEQKFHVFNRGDIRQVPLVVLQHVRNLLEIQL